MPASIGWYDTDDTTALASVDAGTVPPGDSYFNRNGTYIEVRAKNDGDQDFTTVNVEIQQAGAYEGYTHLRIAPDSGGTPGAFQDHSANPLSLGALAQGIVEPVWIDVIVPSDATPEVGQTGNLVLIATA